MDKEIRAVDIINFKKVSEFLTGKSFNLRADRDYGKHKEFVDDLLQNVVYWMNEVNEVKGKVSVLEEKPKWKQDAEKKSNPADYIIDEAGQFPLKVPVENFGDAEGGIIGVGKLTTVSKKNVDMDALRKIASREGLKGEFQLTKKKVGIEEKYAFVYAKNIPDQDEQISVDKKGIAFYSKYDLGVFYVKWEGKYIRFDEKAEFDRFANDNLIML